MTEPAEHHEDPEGPIPNICPECEGFGYWLVEDSDEERTCTACGGDGLKPGAPGKST